MIIDHLINRFPNLTTVSNNLRLRDSVVFNIDDSFENQSMYFYEHNRLKLRLNDESTTWTNCGAAMSSLLPFDNMAVNYIDGVLWVFSLGRKNNEYTIGAIFLRHLKDGLIWKPVRKMRRCCFTFVLNDDLSIIDTGIGTTEPADSHWHENNEEEDIYNSKIRTECFFLIENLLSFLSCKNVRTVDVHPPEEKQRKRRKSGALPLLSYKVLELNSVTSSGSSEKKDLWTNRVHLCRGHFAEYGTKGKGLLFGKYAGRYWIEPHARGDKKKGMVVKDYSITSNNLPNECDELSDPETEPKSETELVNP